MINRYKGLALKDLKASIERGFDDFDWVKKDPDLKPLENDPEFKSPPGESAEERVNLV